MADNNQHHVEVTLARDLHVGPRGGLVKADTQVSLPRQEAELLVMQGYARYDKKTQAVAIPAPVATTEGK